jgi:hypothetical protein
MIKLFINYNIMPQIMGIGDLGLGIGDWAQTPIPNPQTPIPKIFFIKFHNKKIY